MQLFTKRLRFIWPLTNRLDVWSNTYPNLSLCCVSDTKDRPGDLESASGVTDLPINIPYFTNIKII